LVADVVEAPLDVTFDEPLRTRPEAEEVAECRVTPPPRPEAVGPVAELRLVIRVQDGPHHLLQQLVRPAGDAQRTQLPSFLRYVRPPCGRPSIPLPPESVDDVRDPPHGHPIRGLVGRPPGQSTAVAVDPPVGPQVQVLVEESSVDAL